VFYCGVPSLRVVGENTNNDGKSFGRADETQIFMMVMIKNDNQLQTL